MSNFRPIDFDNSDAMEKLFLKMQCIEADTRRNKKKTRIALNLVKKLNL